MPDGPTSASRPPLAPQAKWLGIGILTAAAALVVVSVIFIIGDLGSSIGAGLFGSTSTTPLDQSRHLSAGKYVIYERTGSSSGAGGFSVSNNGPTTISPDDVAVTDSNGASVPVSSYTSHTTITRNGTIYSGALDFHAPASGRYRIRITTPDPVHIIVARDFGSAFASAVPWFAAAFGGLALLVLGIVVLVRGPRRAA